MRQCVGTNLVPQHDELRHAGGWPGFAYRVPWKSQIRPRQRLERPEGLQDGLTYRDQREPGFVRVEELVARHGCPHRGEEEAAEDEGGDEGDGEHGEHHAPGARRGRGCSTRAAEWTGQRASSEQRTRFISCYAN